MSAEGYIDPISAGGGGGGDATAANQVAGNNLLTTINGKITAVDTGAVVVASSALPTGAATAAKQPALGTAGTASADVLTVQGVASMTALKVDGSGVTQPVSGTVTAGNTAGDVASGSADSGNPVKIGGVARTANPTAVTTGQRVNATFDKLGKQVVVGSIRDLKGTQKTTITSSTAETTIVTADATNFLDLYGLVISNTSSTFTKVTIKDATSGTTRFVFSVPAQDTRGFMLPESAAHPQATANNNWTATCGTSVADIEITALFVKNL